MPSDFANRSARKTSKSSKKGSTKRPAKRGSNPPPRRFFHGPSFAGGIVFGALLFFGGAYLPELLPKLLAKSDPDPIDTAVTTEPAAPEPPKPTVRYEFDSVLRNSEVLADPTAYANAARPDVEPKEFLLQAASFRSQQEADALRAELLLLNLPAVTDMVAISSGRWYRVTVGPFGNRTEAQRAMTTLRGKNISPMWIKRDAD